MAKLSDNLAEWTDKMLMNYIFEAMNGWKKEHQDKEWDTFRTGVATYIKNLEDKVKRAEVDSDRARRDARQLKAEFEKLQEAFERFKHDLKTEPFP